MSRKRRRNNSLKKAGIVFLVICLVLLGVALGLLYLRDKYTVSNVLVEGNIHYTDDEIKEIVLSDRFSDNSLFLSYKYKNREIQNVPFVETISVNIVSDDTIRITVFEKALAGYIEYLGRYVYFDKDGIVVENSNVKTEGVPEVLGVDLDYIVLYKALPAEDPELFKKVLNITQLMEKYQVTAERMYFADNGDIILFAGDIAASLGKDENLDIKIMNLPSILNKLEGMKGTLHMEKYDEDTKRVSFEAAK